jgi:hypothetical protein
MYSWWWVRLSPETCRVKPLRRIKIQLLHLVGLISLLYLILVSCFLCLARSVAAVTQNRFLSSLSNFWRQLNYPFWLLQGGLHSGSVSPKNLPSNVLNNVSKDILHVPLNNVWKGERTLQETRDCCAMKHAPEDAMLLCAGARKGAPCKCAFSRDWL